MRNYPHLYTPGSNKKASFSNQIKTPKKTVSIIGSQQHEYNKIPSTRTINNPTTNRRTNKYPRISSRSIEEMHLNSRSSQDNYDMIERKNLLFHEEQRQMAQYYPPPTFKQFANHSMPLNNHYMDRYSQHSNEENQLFQKSYQKIGEIKYQVHNKNIDHQLNEVLELIKEQKLRANETVRTLKKAADHYKKICQNVTKTFVNSSVNTEQHLPYFKQTDSRDSSTQYSFHQVQLANRQNSPTFSKKQNTPTPQTSRTQHQETYQSPSKKTSPSKQQSQKSPQKIDGKQMQIYTKLATMLQDMNINSKEILPQEIQLNFEIKNYKTLTEAQVIKIQKFFIKKLVEKIPK